MKGSKHRPPPKRIPPNRWAKLRPYVIWAVTLGVAFAIECWWGRGGAVVMAAPLLLLKLKEKP